MLNRSVTVLGRANSLNVRKVMWCAAELGLAVAREDYGRGARPTDGEEFLAKNPNGKVPVLVHGNAVLWESNTIVRYLCAAFGGRHIPSDPLERALCERWMDWQLGTLQVAMSGLFHEMVVAPGSVPADQLAQAQAQTAALMTMLDAALTQEFLAGRQLTAADFAVAPKVHRYLKLVAAPPPLPNLFGYYRRLAARPAFAAHVGFAAP
ncbi:MAG: glutathione S-transferase family protein [Pseudomonadota bacterium]